MNGALFLAIGAAMCALDLIAGLYLVNQGGDLALRSEADRAKAEGVRRLGRLVLILAPLFFLVFAALAFGLIPAADIEPVRLG